MPTTIECAVKNRTTSLPETVLLTRDHDWGGHIEYHAIVKTPAALATLGIVFRWKDRNGTAQSHSALGLTLLNLGPLVANRFELWTQYAAPSTITVEITVGGLGTPAFDFFCNGYGNSYGP